MPPCFTHKNDCYLYNHVLKCTRAGVREAQGGGESAPSGAALMSSFIHSLHTRARAQAYAKLKEAEGAPSGAARTALVSDALATLCRAPLAANLEDLVRKLARLRCYEVRVSGSKSYLMNQKLW